MKYAALALLLTPFVVEFEMTFEPEETTLVRTYEAELALSLDEMSSTVFVDGDEQQQQVPDIEMEFTLTQSMVVRDELKGLSDGRPTELSRTFEEIRPTERRSMSSEAGDQEQENDGESELEGTTVKFAWDADEDDYEIEFTGEDGGDEELLEDLYEDMDLRELLPEESVGEGDSWELEPTDVFRYLFYPAGRVPAQFGDRPRSDRSSLFHMADEIEGDVMAELIGVETDAEGGLRLARVRVAGSFTGELSDEREEENEFGKSDIELTRTMELELEAVLLWDLGARRLHEVSAEGTISLLENTVNRPNIEDGPEVEIQSIQQLSGPVTIRYGVAGE